MRWVKPAVDRVGALVLLVVASPILAVVALAVRLRLGSPVIYRQTRVGQGGRPFTVYKFRSMRPDRRATTPAEPPGEERRVDHKSPDDPRLVPLGRRLRSASLDELPQLFNVLRGEMSLVGPRPELPSVVARYEPWQHRRHEVKPGLTGLWQIKARGDVPMHEGTELDLDYVDQVSLGTDLRILMRTPMALLRRPGS